VSTEPDSSATTSAPPDGVQCFKQMSLEAWRHTVETYMNIYTLFLERSARERIRRAGWL